MWGEKQFFIEALPPCDQLLSLFHLLYFISQRQKIYLDESYKSLDRCKTPTASGLHKQRVPAGRQLYVYGLMI